MGGAELVLPLSAFDDQAAWQQLALPCVGESRACIVKTQLHVGSIVGELAEQAAAVNVADAFSRVCAVGSKSAGLRMRC